MFEIIDSTLKENEIKDKLEKYVLYLVEKLNLDECIFNVILVSDEEIRNLNKTYRDIDRPTDVLSFALEDYKDIEDDYRMLGDIYIAPSYIKKQAKDFDNTYEGEMYLMVCHGLLHLLGYDHIKEDDRKVMFEKQEMMVDEYSRTT